MCSSALLSEHERGITTADSANAKGDAANKQLTDDLQKQLTTAKKELKEMEDKLAKQEKLAKQMSASPTGGSAAPSNPPAGSGSAVGQVAPAAGQKLAAQTPTKS